MYLDELSPRQQTRIIHAVNIGQPFEKCPEQSTAAREFFDSLMSQKAKLPGVIFECPEIEDDEESRATREIMFSGMDLDGMEL